MRENRLHQSCRTLVLPIARHTNSKNDEHKAWPSLDTLEVETQLARSSISKAIDALDSVGAFTEYKQGGGRTYSTYTLDMDKIESWCNKAWIEAKLRVPSDELSEVSRGNGEHSQTNAAYRQTNAGYRYANPAYRQTEGSLPSREPNLDSIRVVDPVFHQGSEAATPPAAAAVSLFERGKTKPNPEEPEKTYGASGLSAKKDKTNPEAEKPRRDVCDECLKWNGQHKPECPVPAREARLLKARSKAATANGDLGEILSRVQPL